jgi:hypothetical protein
MERAADHGEGAGKAECDLPGQLAERMSLLAGGYRPNGFKSC